MASFTPTGGSGGLPVSVTVDGVSSPLVVNISIPVAATEQSYTFPVGTKRFLLALRPGSPADLKLSYVSATSGSTYITVRRGNWYSESELDTTTPLTIYFQSTQASTLEVISWS